MLSSDEVTEIRGSQTREHCGKETLAPYSTLQESKEELERVLHYPPISRSSNLVRFLSFICNKYFDGEVEEIRERTVAVKALGRKESTFDSHADPIVRVIARDLRKKLSEYYENEGRDHRLQIVLPRGRYIPQFVGNQATLPAELRHVDPAAEDEPLLLPAAQPEEAGFDSALDSPLDKMRGGWKTAGRYALAGAALVMAFLAGYVAGHWRGSPTVVLSMPTDWGEPAWRDEFEGPSGHQPDPTRWVQESNAQDGSNSRNDSRGAACGYGPNCVAAQPSAFLNGAGQLVLRASRNRDVSWTTARLSTRGIKDFQYGRIEARMKLPVGAGLWPAFWLMGSNFSKVGWPAAGSIDIMENVGAQNGRHGLGPSVIRSTLHGPGAYGQNGMWRDYSLPNGARVDDSGFHTYGIIWSPQVMQFYVDSPSNVYFVKRSSDLPKGTEWVFDKPFYLVLSLEVGGDWPGSADNMTPNPADMVIDYVRVYSLPPALQKTGRRSF
jgi:beta-glucanase (GH16 family)